MTLRSSFISNWITQTSCNKTKLTIPSFEVSKVLILCIHVIIRTKVHKELIILPQQEKDGITVLELVFSALLLKHSFYLLNY